MRRIIQIMSFQQLRPVHWILIFSIFILIHIPAILHDNGKSNAYVLLAKSISRGSLSLAPGDMNVVQGTNILDTGDLIFYHNKYYLPYPPFPALLIIPLLPFDGSGINSVLICLLLSCLNIFLICNIFKKLQLDSKTIGWLIYGFIFGTAYWFILLSSHHVYGFAQVVAVTGVLLMLNELFGRGRSILIGLFLGFAFLSRQLTIGFAILVIGYFVNLYIIGPNKDVGVFRRKILLFLSTLGVSVGAYLVYNMLRFGNPLDTGYGNIIFIGILKERVDAYGVFSSHYVLYNLYNYLFKGFNIVFSGKDMLRLKDVDPFGSALLIASPFLISSFKTGWDKILRVFSWLTIVVIFLALLFYHNNGKDQINASRFTLDFLPLLLILAGLGAKNIPSWLFKGMIVYSILINIVAVAIHLLHKNLL